MAAHLPDQPHAVQHFGKDLGDVLRFCTLDLVAGLVQSLQVLEVVVGLL